MVRRDFPGLPVKRPKDYRLQNDVFYHFADEKILEVWSVIDKPSIEGQLK